MFLVVCANPAIDAFVELPHLSFGKSHRVVSEERYPGGKGVHVALALRELDQDVALLGFWAGPTGEWVRKECERFGVEVHGPRLRDGWTRICQTFKTKDTFDETEFLGESPSFEFDAGEELLATFRQLSRAAHTTVISGSLPQQSPPDFYQKLLQITVSPTRVLDCVGEPLQLALAENISIVHLNQEEASIVTGTQDPLACCAFFAEQAEFVAITCGRDGLYLRQRHQGTVHANVSVPSVISAVGSGDCLTAGLAYGRAKKLPLDEIARWGVSCGAANCIRPELGMLHASDVKNLLAKTNVRRI